jgi:hypothetical protein
MITVPTGMTFVILSNAALDRECSSTGFYRPLRMESSCACGLRQRGYHFGGSIGCHGKGTASRGTGGAARLNKGWNQAQVMIGGAIMSVRYL